MPTPCTAIMPYRIENMVNDRFDEIATGEDGTQYLISQRLRIDCSDKPVWFHPENPAARVDSRAQTVFMVCQFVPTAEGSPVGFLYGIANCASKREALSKAFQDYSQTD